MAPATGPPDSPGAHFHIRWSDGHLDYERFATAEHAAIAAHQLARPNEDYAIEGFDQSCEQCAELLRKVANA